MDKYTDDQLLNMVITTGKHILIAGDVLAMAGERDRSSLNPSYRRALRILKRAEIDGYLYRRHFPQINFTIFWKIP